MNIMLSSRSDEWGTPGHILDMVREVLGGPIDFDPASDEHFNETVKASVFLTKGQDALTTEWPATGNVFLNPPGGKRKNRSNTALFWERLIQHRDAFQFGHAVFMGFSLECLQTTQRSRSPILMFPFCVPSKRIRFVAKTGTFAAPSHSNVIVYVPCKTNNADKFRDVFSRIGVCT